MSLAACSGFGLCDVASAADLRAIFTRIGASPTSQVPGALDAAGLPVAATWTEIYTLSVRDTHDDWMLSGRTNQGSLLERILIKGSGTSGTAFLQEGQPVQGGGKPGEVYDFFDGDGASVQSFPASWNNLGNIAYSARARGGVLTNDEKLGVFNGTTHTIILQQGEPIASGACTGLLYGNQMGSVTMLNNGEVAFGNSVIGGCSNSPVLFRGTAAILESSITEIGAGAIVAGERITGVPQWWERLAQTRDGQHVAVICGTTHNVPQQSTVVLVNGNAVARLNVAGGGVTPTQFNRVRLAENGDWYLRGQTAAGHYAMRNGTLVAQTGQPIYTGSSEQWSVVFNTFIGNANGNWILHGLTNNPDANLNTVLVLNGTEVIVRESDPVDVNGDGEYNDDAFIRTIKDDTVWLTNNNVLYFVGTLKNAAGTNLLDALIRADLGGGPPPPCPPDINGDGVVNVTDLLAVIGAWGACPPPCPPDVNNDGNVNVTDLLAVIGAWGPCP